MTTTIPRHRRTLGAFTRGALWSVAALAIGAGVVVGAQGGRADAAATNGGSLTIIDDLGGTLASGGSATAFGLRPPTGAACTGDTATGGYKVSSYMVPSSVDPATLTFDNSGPIPNATGNPTPSAFRQPMYSNGTPFVNKNTAIDNGAGGVLVNLPLFSFAGVGFASGDIPAGSYNIGYACVKGTASSTQLDKYWNAQITVAVNAQDPISVAWTSNATPPSTTTTVGNATTTTAAGATTTTAAGETTTVLDTSTTDTSASSSSVADTTQSTTAESSTTAFVSGSGGGIVSTGIDATKLVVWALIALVLGRLVVLIARRVRVVPPEQR